MKVEVTQLDPHPAVDIFRVVAQRVYSSIGIISALV